MKIFQPLILAGLLAAPVVYASADTPFTPMTQGQVSFVTGGVGSNEVAAIKQMEKDYPLTLEFAVRAAPRDEYTADVQVKLLDSKGHEVLDTTTDGPFLLAKLPAGHYQLQASLNGQTRTRQLAIERGKHTHLLVEMLS